MTAQRRTTVGSDDVSIPSCLELVAKAAKIERPRCPDCNGRLDVEEFGSVRWFHCPRCDYEFDENTTNARGERRER